jgi:hypothetical protein
MKCLACNNNNDIPNRRLGSGHHMSSHNEFSHFVEICENIRSTNSKNAKVSILSDYLAGLDGIHYLFLFCSYLEESFHEVPN